MQTIVGLVANGMGVALVPASLRSLHTKSVVYKTVQDLFPTVEMGVIWRRGDSSMMLRAFLDVVRGDAHRREDELKDRSEEHTSELQSRQYLVCRLLLE